MCSYLRPVKQSQGMDLLAPVSYSTTQYSYKETKVRINFYHEMKVALFSETSVPSTILDGFTSQYTMVVPALWLS